MRTSSKSIDSIIAEMSIKDKIAQMRTSSDNAEDIVGCADDRAVEWDIASKAVTVVKNENHLLPLRRVNEKTLILTPYDSEQMSMEYAVRKLTDEQMLPPAKLFTREEQA